MTTRELKRLNAMFVDGSGLNPYGEPNFRWKSTQELFYVVDEGIKQVERPIRGTKKSILFLDRVVTRHCWAEIYGRRYVLTMWEPPDPPAIWRIKTEDRIPWPGKGEWKLIENIMLEPGQDPDEYLTAAACHAIAAQRDKTLRQLTNECTDAAERRARSQKEEFKDALDDAMTAFGKIPGSNSGGVSIRNPHAKTDRYDLLSFSDIPARSAPVVAGKDTL